MPLFNKYIFICYNYPGIPTLVRSFLPPEVKIVLQGENGVLGIGQYPRVNEEDSDVVNAGNEAVSIIEGASFFQSSVSFGMYRGRHMSATILGGMQVSRKGDIANWVVPNKLIKVNYLVYTFIMCLFKGNGWCYGFSYFRSKSYLLHGTY